MAAAAAGAGGGVGGSGGGEEIRPMHDSSAAAYAHDITALRDNLARDGYLYLPQLLDRDAVLAAMRRFVQAVGDAVHMGPTGDADVRLSAGGAGAIGPDNGIVRPVRTFLSCTLFVLWRPGHRAYTHCAAARTHNRCVVSGQG